MSTLYQLVGEYKIFEEQFDKYVELVEAGELPEDAVLDTLESLSGSVEDKVDNITCVYKQQMYEVAMIKAEIARLQERLKAKDNAAGRLKEYLQASMLQMGMNKLETPRNRLSFRKSEKVMIEDSEGFVRWAQESHPELLTFKQPEPNKTEIKRVIKGGQPIEGCRIESCVNIQIK